MAPFHIPRCVHSLANKMLELIKACLYLTPTLSKIMTTHIAGWIPWPTVFLVVCQAILYPSVLRRKWKYYTPIVMYFCCKMHEDKYVNIFRAYADSIVKVYTNLAYRKVLTWTIIYQPLNYQCLVCKYHFESQMIFWRHHFKCTVSCYQQAISYMYVWASKLSQTITQDIVHKSSGLLVVYINLPIQTVEVYLKS